MAIPWNKNGVCTRGMGTSSSPSQSVRELAAPGIEGRCGAREMQTRPHHHDHVLHLHNHLLILQTDQCALSTSLWLKLDRYQLAKIRGTDSLTLCIWLFMYFKKNDRLQALTDFNFQKWHRKQARQPSWKQILGYTQLISLYSGDSDGSSSFVHLGDDFPIFIPSNLSADRHPNKALISS
jgi:hypothetical protein